ncbi:MAG: alpha helicase [Desulfobacterales bacterium]|nr:alpha helicase [Desulfobacterales bacterium]
MDILDAAGRCGLTPKKMANTKGGEYRCACPYCGGDPGRSDRFLLWPVERGGRGAFWCRQCNKSGDTVQLLVDHCGYSFRDAFQATGREATLNYRPSRYRPATNSPCASYVFEPRVCEAPAEIWQTRAAKFIENAHQALLENKTMMSYLAGRGLDHQAVVGFRLGWFEGENGRNCMFRPRQAWGLSKIKNEKTGRDKMLWIPRGLVIPKFKQGKPERIRIRRPDEDLKTEKDVRYYVLPGSGQSVMGHNPKRQAFVVVEAELDGMMIARHAGSLVGTVGLGSAGVKPDSSAFYILKKALRILVALDYDRAGKMAWKWWKENFSSAKLWPVPMGKDPGEAFKMGLDIKEWIKQGLPPVLTMAEDERYVPPKGMYPIQELKYLLNRYPVQIEATEQTAKILYDPGFQNRSIRQRIHDLFFKDDEVHWFLRMYHPDKVINGKNCEVILKED